mmetsp:Transcript_1436/g.2978  ORF Transcript_1436/g.2978 Transcript_1436/m.2978 type:complete len:211 (+) Transcript_1436:766-1398(+)
MKATARAIGRCGNRLPQLGHLCVWILQTPNISITPGIQRSPRRFALVSLGLVLHLLPLLANPLVSSMIPPSGVDAAAALLKLASLMPRVHMRLQVGNLILELQELLALLVGAKHALDSLRGAAPAHLLLLELRTERGLDVLGSLQINALLGSRRTGLSLVVRQVREVRVLGSLAAELQGVAPWQLVAHLELVDRASRLHCNLRHAVRFRL